MLETTLLPRTPVERGWWLKDPASDRKAFGFVLHKSNDVWVVHRTLKQSPAELSGIQTGDELQAVDRYLLSGGGDIMELFHLVNLDEHSTSHDLAIIRQGSNKITLSVQKQPLRALLATDYDLGGHILDTCYSCRFCRSISIGWSDCGGTQCFNQCSVG
jgi:hypothetical protein